MPGTWVGEGPGGRRCRARRRRHSIPADPACDSEVVGEGAPVVARKHSLAVRETILIVVLPGVPAADDDGRAIMSGDVLCRRRVIAKERTCRLSINSSLALAHALRGTSRGNTCSRRVEVLLHLRHNTTQRSGLRLLPACRLFLVHATCRRGLFGVRRWGHGGSAREKALFRTRGHLGDPRAGITAKEAGTARAQATECSASQVADHPEESEEEGKPNGCHGAWYAR